MAQTVLSDWSEKLSAFIGTIKNLRTHIHGKDKQRWSYFTLWCDSDFSKSNFAFCKTVLFFVFFFKAGKKTQHSPKQTNQLNAGGEADLRTVGVWLLQKYELCYKVTYHSCFLVFLHKSIICLHLFGFILVDVTFSNMSSICCTMYNNNSVAHPASSSEGLQ